MSSANTTRRNSTSGATSILSSNGGGSNSQASSSNLNLNPNSIKAKNKPQIITPKIQENQLGEAIQYRSQILCDFKELGQPDLVHISKYDKSVKQEIGEYHYVTGINTSSVIQPFMYLQTIQLNDREQATHKHMKIGTYCSYNIFSKGDLRIRCQFPGSASPMIQFVPANKNKITITISNGDEKNQHLWIETYVSSLIRCILFSESIERQLPGMCKFNPIQSTKDTKEAITLMCKLLFRGSETGCSDIINRPSLINNYLVDALLELLSLTKYYDIAIKEIENLMLEKRINLNVLIVRILLLKNDYAKAVRMMHDCLIKIPRDGWMLNEQASFLIDQNRPDLALIPAMISVECLPSEFICWKNLILVYILKKDLKNALLALNSSPMYTNKRKDIYAAIKPKNFDFPFPLEGKIEEIWKDCEAFGCISGIGGIVEFSQNLEISKTNKYRLRVYEETKLNCTFKEAYDLLALMTKQCGWSDLLKIRSEIFVMEDEYNEVVKTEQHRENTEESKSENGQIKEQLKNLKNESTISLTEISDRFKCKRLSEKWLDSLFLIFYENLKNVLIYQNELVSKPEVQFPPLEWELIGDECFKVHFYQEGFTPFETCLNKRFSIFASNKILRYFLAYIRNETVFNELNAGILCNKAEAEGSQDEADADSAVQDRDALKAKETIANLKLDPDYILKVCCKLISWTSRFYGEFPILCLEVLATLMNMPDCDATVLKSKLEYLLMEEERQQKKNKKDKSSAEKTLYKDMEASQNVVGLVDRYISWLTQFDEEI